VRRPAENDRLLAALGVGDGTATDPSEADDDVWRRPCAMALRLRRPETRWLSTGWGGRLRADAAYNVSVPEGFDRTDLGAYRDDERLARAGFKSEEDPPTLFTRRFDGPRVRRTSRIGRRVRDRRAVEPGDVADGSDGSDRSDGRCWRLGARRRGVDRGTAPATRYGQPGSRNDAAARRRRGGEPRRGRGRGEGRDVARDGGRAGDDERRGGRRRRPDRGAAFSGSATPVGAAARVCVRDAVRASLRSRYPDGDLPGPAADAEHGVVADERTSGGFRAMTTDNNDTDSTTDDDADAPTDGEPTERDELRPRRPNARRGRRPPNRSRSAGRARRVRALQAWWGDGKGKTTAAMGMGFRAAGHGYRVHMLQFMKGGADSVEGVRGEYNAIAAMPGFSYENAGHYGWHGLLDGSGDDDDEHEAKASAAFERAEDLVLVAGAADADLAAPIPLDGDPDDGVHMLILDEVLYAADRGLVDPEEVVALAESKPETLELVLTGSHGEPDYLDGVCRPDHERPEGPTRSTRGIAPGEGRSTDVAPIRAA